MFDLYILYFVTFCYWMSIITFGMYGWDKHQAVYGRWRIPEAVLISTALFGGAWGAVMGMFLFRHKTLHTLFQICNPIFLVIQILLGCFLYYKYNIV